MPLVPSVVLSTMLLPSEAGRDPVSNNSTSPQRTDVVRRNLQHETLVSNRRKAGQMGELELTLLEVSPSLSPEDFALIDVLCDDWIHPLKIRIC